MGPGTRPYRRSNHVVAALIEEVAAQLAEPYTENASHIRREDGVLFRTITRAADQTSSSPEMSARRVWSAPRSGSGNQSNGHSLRASLPAIFTRGPYD